MLIFTACDQDIFRKNYSAAVGYGIGMAVSLFVCLPVLALLADSRR
jgi:hypothetical protein